MANLFRLLSTCIFLPFGSHYCHSQADGGFYRLVWSDEFDRDGRPDASLWTYDLGDGCPAVCNWGNNELQAYTDVATNVHVEKGLLHITARREERAGKSYTSARLVSRGLGDFLYGKIEARIKLPSGRGTWPAFWMLPTDWKYGGWPGSGEIDIMEHVGYEPDSIFGTVHTKRYNHSIGTQKSGAVFATGTESEFHSYSVEWDPEKMHFQMDGKTYYTFVNDGQGPDSWPFDQRFHVILNLAVGGNWGGKYGVDQDIWPQQMLVDYVRIYQK